MIQIIPVVKNFISKFWLEVIPAVAASVLAGFLLTHFHLRGDPAPQNASLAVATPSQEASKGGAGAKAADGPLTATEDRKITREILRSRRDSQEMPAEVTKRVPSIPPEDLEAAIKAAIATPADQAKTIPTPRPAPGPAVTRIEPTRPAPVDLGRRPDDLETPPQVAGQPTLSGAANGQIYVPPNASQTLPTMDVSAREAPPTRIVGDAPQGPVGSALSTASVATGKAVNAVGDTVGWVIGLPGRIIGR